MTLGSFIEALKRAGYTQVEGDPREDPRSGAPGDKPVNLFSVLPGDRFGPQCPGAVTSVALAAGYGYYSFITEFFFDEADQFIGHSAWE